MKALDLKSNGVSPRRFKSCSQRELLLVAPVPKRDRWTQTCHPHRGTLHPLSRITQSLPLISCRSLTFRRGPRQYSGEQPCTSPYHKKKSCNNMSTPHRWVTQLPTAHHRAPYSCVTLLPTPHHPAPYSPSQPRGCPPPGLFFCWGVQLKGSEGTGGCCHPPKFIQP